MSDKRAYESKMTQLEQMKQEQQTTNVDKNEEQSSDIPLKLDSVSESDGDTEDSSKLSEVEQEAVKQGWRPQDQYKGKPDDFVDAATFIERGPVFRRIERLKDQIQNESEENKKLRDTVKALVDDIRTAEQKGRDQMVRELNTQKQEAIELKDLDTYRAIEERERELNVKSTQQETPPKLSTTRIEDTPEYQEFEAINPWVKNIKTDAKSYAMIQYAHFKVEELVRSNPNASLREQYDLASKVVREEFPDQFKIKSETVSKLSSPGIPGMSKPKSNNIKADVNTLTPSQRLIYNSLSAGSYGMTQDEYLKILAERK